MASSTRPKPNLTSFDPHHRSFSSRFGTQRSSSLPTPASVRSLSSSTTFLSRSSSTTCVAISGKSSSSVRRSHIDHKPMSPSQSQSHYRRVSVTSKQKKTCMCSPTTHPGSFRCSLHKNTPSGLGGRGSQKNIGSSSGSSNSSLNFRKSVMTNSLVRIGGVEGSELVKRALSPLIRPSSDQHRRRLDFRPRPSRLSVMSKAQEDY